MPLLRPAVIRKAVVRKDRQDVAGEADRVRGAQRTNPQRGSQQGCQARRRSGSIAHQVEKLFATMLNDSVQATFSADTNTNSAKNSMPLALCP